MQRFNVDPSAAPKEIRNGLCEIINDRADRFVKNRQAITLTFEKIKKGAKGFAVTRSDDGIRIQYHKTVEAFRALGCLLGETENFKNNFSQTPHHDLISVMIDVSRNGVLRPDVLRSLLRRMALMGINGVILYTEDTFEIPGEPFWGYLRGGYTQKELRELDQYAANLGIEMFPCIQTLGHLAMVLQWPAYSEYVDTEQVLLADHQKTYTLLEKIIKEAKKPYKSSRIHIGMDEAFGIGLGRYRDLKGSKPQFEILNDHLGRVRNICKKQGLRPMIWSDMFFRIGSKTHDYYDPKAIVPRNVIKRIPKDVQLVYWDYYHLDQKFYADFIDRHRALGSEPIMAGGVWTWNRFWCSLPYSMKITDACMGACREKNVREIMMTLWSDGGAECDFFSALPGLQYFAEHAYADVVELKNVRSNLLGSCEAPFDDYVRASDIDAVPSLKKPHESSTNAGKFLFWQDPLLAIIDPLFEGVDLSGHYEKLADALLLASKKGTQAQRLRFPAQIASVLSIKAHLRRNIATAYAKNDRKKLRVILKKDLPTLTQRVKKQWLMHRELWMSLYKPFGWESVDRRYGGLLARLETVGIRLQEYLDGTIDSIPELEAKLEKVFADRNGDLPVLHASRVATPSVIK